MEHTFLSTLSLRRATADKHVQPPKRPNFYPRSPCGERPLLLMAHPVGRKISIHALLAESDCWNSSSRLLRQYFYPRSPCGERLVFVGFFMAQNLFLSTLSLRRATTAFSMYGALPAFLSTLSLRRATELVLSLLEQLRHFYPRSPCGERPPRCGWFQFVHYFYPRSPCGERHVIVHSAHPHKSFLSTLSLRRATSTHQKNPSKLANFYPRSPCGERRIRDALPETPCYISIHALLAESDKYKNIIIIIDELFLSTLSLRRATSSAQFVGAESGYFYPRSPCGERQSIKVTAISVREFLSTLSLRRATTDMSKRLIELCISIHALLAESDTRKSDYRFR